MSLAEYLLTGIAILNALGLALGAYNVLANRAERLRWRVRDEKSARDEAERHAQIVDMVGREVLDEHGKVLGRIARVN